MKNIIKYSLLTLCLHLLLVGCKEQVFKQLDEIYSHNPSEAIILESFAPIEGSESTEITLFGDNFSSDASQVQVTINGITTPVLGSNKKRIIIKVPAGIGSGKLKVTIGNKSIESNETFTYAIKRTVSTYAVSGNGAEFNFFVNAGMAIDSKGIVYVADVFNSCIRKINADGTISTYAGIPGVHGNVDGSVDVALFDHPTDIAFDADDNMYVADTWNWAIKKVTPDGIVSTLKAWVVPFPQGIVYNQSNGSIYIVSALPAASNGKMGELLPNNQYIERGLDVPVVSGGIAMDMNNNLIIADNSKSVIYSVNTTTWSKEIIAGQTDNPGWVDGIGEEAKFQNPWGVAVDQNNNIYVAGSGHIFNGDIANNASNIRMIEAGTNKVTTIAGGGTPGYKDGLGGEALFSVSSAVAVDNNGVIFVLDKGNVRIRKIVSE